MRSRSAAMAALSVRKYAPIKRLSRTLMAENNRRPSGTWAMPACTKSAGAPCVIGLPSTAIAPAVGVIRPDRQRINVVLPAPFEPMMQTNSPAPTSRLMSHNTCTSP